MNAETKKYPFPIIPRTAVWLTISALVILAGGVKMGINKANTGQSLTFGIDFNGGAAYVYKFAERPGDSTPQVLRNLRPVIESAGIQRAKLQEFADGEVQVRTLTGAEAESVPTAADDAKAEANRILEVLRAKYGDVELVGSELVGPVIGEYLRKQGFFALIVGCLLILFYISIRYSISGVGNGLIFGLCAVIALIHDVLITIGVYAWTGTEVNTGFVAAILTVIGYSVNDTVIIYDRIRENLRALDAPLRRNISRVGEVIEDSLWQTMARSLMTTGTTLMPLMMLFLFGGVSIRDFAFALVIGIFCGAYSSIFVAAPTLLIAYRRQLAKSATEAGRNMPQRRRPERRRPETPAAEPAQPAAQPAAKPVSQPATTASPDDDDAADQSSTQRKSSSGTKGPRKRKRRH